MASSHVSRITAGGVSDRRIGHSLYGYCTTAAATAKKVVNLYTGSSTTADGSWTAADLFHGLTIEVRFQYANSVANPTLNVNGTGAKTIFRYGTSAPSTSAVSSWQNQEIVTLVYDTLLASTGCWVMEKGYRTGDTNTIGIDVRTNGSTRPASDKGYRYRIWLSSVDDKQWVPMNTSTATDNTTKRTLNTRPINPFGDIIYYSTNGTTNAGDVLTRTTTWQQYGFNIGYSYTVDNWVENDPVYLKCTPLTNGSAIMQDIVQDLPTTRDGKIYIYLGIAYGTMSLQLKINHPIYYHNGDGIRLWSGQQNYIEEVTYSQLKSLRDNGNLIPGAQYKITDYQCKINKYRTEVISHPFDIIVTANTQYELSENARACKRQGDTYYSSCDLSKWQLKYCIDNDANKFDWADTSSGKGVIYYMKDDHNNECPYDFKQIVFYLKKVTSIEPEELFTTDMYQLVASSSMNFIKGTSSTIYYCYTFSSIDNDNNIIDASVAYSYVSNNIITPRYATSRGNYLYHLNHVVFINKSLQFCGRNTLINCYNIVFVNGCEDNILENCANIIIGENSNNNIIKNSYQTLIMEESYHNQLSYCNTILIGAMSYDNILKGTASTSVYSVVMYIECYQNTIIGQTQYIEIKQNSFNNIINSLCKYIELNGKNCIVLNNVQGTNSSHLLLNISNSNAITYVGKNSSGVIKKWVPADGGTPTSL